MRFAKNDRALYLRLMTETVALARIMEYESQLLDAAVELLMDEAGFRPSRGERVLVKPNLVNSTNAAVSCTHPLVVRAACRFLLDRGVRVTVADSPAFGSAAQVAKASGLVEALKALGLEVRGLAAAQKTTLPCGVEIGVSRHALEAEAILNVPRLKAHCQMRVTGAVKNLFGCVSGARKALAHNRLGNRPDLFAAMVVDICELVPHSVSLMDAVRPMHRNGPVKGEAYELGMLGASASPHAVDAMVYEMLNLSPSQVPLWAEALRRDLPGAQPGELRYPLERPQSFDVSGMVIPEKLEPVRFDPFRVFKGRIKSLKKRLCGD